MATVKEKILELLEANTANLQMAFPWAATLGVGGYDPTATEICNSLDMNKSGAILTALRELKKEGHITFEKEGAHQTSRRFFRLVYDTLTVPIEELPLWREAAQSARVRIFEKELKQKPESIVIYIPAFAAGAVVHYRSVSAYDQEWSR